MLRNIVLSFFSILLCLPGISQTWYNELSSGANFHDVRKSFDDYKDNVQLSRTGPIKPFERWSHKMEERTYPTGELQNASNYFKIHKALEKSSNTFKSNIYPSWTSLGPDEAVGAEGNGRVNFIRFHPDSSDVIFLGAPAGGLWKSTDGGVVFKIMDDKLPVIGCSDLAINPNTPNIMYLATGDRDGSDTYSIGVLKSIDGGITWDTTGLDWQVSQLRTIARLAINPFNPEMVFAATTEGVYKTVNGGVTWARKWSGNFKDIEFKPGDSSTVYASGETIIYSNDAGETFNTTNVSGFINRIEMAVTEDDPSYVYAISSYAGNNGLDAIWKSTNSGQSFTKILNNNGAGTGTNYLGWESNGTGAGGQGWYDLAMAVSPIDKDHVLIGGVNVWGSLDGGTTWGVVAHWQGQSGANIHADQHDLIFKPGSGKLYAANDGGIYSSNNPVPLTATFTNLTGTLQITQSYRLGISQNTFGYVLTGNQDNGTFQRIANGSFFKAGGGDGFECIVDFTTDNIFYSSLYYGAISKSTNGSGSSLTLVAGNGVNGITEGGAWETPYVMSPFQNNVIYIGYNNIWLTGDGGQSWVKRNNSSLPNSGKVNQLAIAPWDPDMLAATKSGNIYLTTNAGATFTNVTNGLPNLFITNVQFSPMYDPNTFTIYVTLSGYSNGSKVYRSTDGAQTWQNISAGIPNVPANCIVIDPNSSDEQLYVGTDIGVFYKNSSMTQFELYSEGLPNTIVEEMEIHGTSGHIIACTYGRGIWEVPMMSVVGLDDENFISTNNADLTYYPNPFNDNLQIDFNLKEDMDVKLDLIDLQGKIIYSFSEKDLSIGSHKLEIGSEIEGLSKGFYLLKFRAGSEEITSKVIKN